MHQGHDEHERVEHPLTPIDGFFTDLFTATREPPRWIIKDLLPPGLVFVGAPPKAGKSTIEMAIAMLVAGFRCEALPPFLSQVERPGIVMGFSAEATAGELRDMAETGLKVKGEANSAVLICDEPFQWRLDDPDGQETLLGWLKEYKPRLVFIDPLRDFHQLEEKDSGGMNRLLRPLQRWAKENDACVMVVHHTKKRVDGDKRENYTPEDLRGTSALFGLADGVLMITKLENGFYRMHTTFKRAAGWDRVFRVAAYDYVDMPATEKLGEVENLVLRAVRMGIMQTKQLVAQTHAAAERVKDTLKLLERNGLIRQTEKGWVPVETKSAGAPVHTRRSGSVGVARDERRGVDDGHGERRRELRPRRDAPGRSEPDAGRFSSRRGFHSLSFDAGAGD